MYRILSVFFTGLFFVSCLHVVIAQDSVRHKGFGLETNVLVGKIVKHSVKFTAPVPPVSVALDVNLVWQTYGKRAWNQLRGYPVTGLGIMFTDYRSNKIFGKCVGLYPNLQVPVVRSGRLEWTMRFGLGLAYVTKKYQAFPEYDTLNTAISTNINAFAVYMTDLRYRINEHWDMQVGANFTHISNALYREPNLGVNFCGLHYGVRYFMTSSNPQKIMRKLPAQPNRWLVDVRVAMAHKEARAAGNPVKPAYIGAISVSRRWNGHNKLFAGIDGAYHEDVYAFLKNYGVELGHEKQHSWDGGFFVGTEYIVGRVGMLGILGTYYRQTFLDFDPLYEKLGVKYYLLAKERGLAKELFLSAMLNTHGAVAEYAEFGIGIAF